MSGTQFQFRGERVADLDCFPALQQHRFTYNEPMPVESCTQSLCDLALQFGEDDEEGGMVRVPNFHTARDNVCARVLSIYFAVACVGCTACRRTLLPPTQEPDSTFLLRCRAGRLASHCWWLGGTMTALSCGWPCL